MIEGIALISARIFFWINVVGFVLTVFDRILYACTAKKIPVDPETLSEDELKALGIANGIVPKGRMLYRREGGAKLPENLLVLIGMLFGGVGVSLGMFMAKRDRYSRSTRTGVPVTAIGETILLFWFISGFWAEGLAKLFS